MEDRVKDLQTELASSQTMMTKLEWKSINLDGALKAEEKTSYLAEKEAHIMMEVACLEGRA